METEISSGWSTKLFFHQLTFFTFAEHSVVRLCQLNGEDRNLKLDALKPMSGWMHYGMVVEFKVVLKIIQTALSLPTQSDVSRYSCLDFEIYFPRED